MRKENRIRDKKGEGEQSSSRTRIAKGPAGGCSVIYSIKYLTLFNVNITATD